VDYEPYKQALESAGIETGAAESHGIFCGLVCGGSDDAQTLWSAEMLNGLDPADLLVQEGEQAMRTVATATLEQMDGPGVGFDLLLPDDEQSLSERADALGHWVQGFLYGLGLTGVVEAKLSAEAAEALRDLAQIAQLDAEADLDSEADEAAFTEIVEFVWVAAMLILEDCGPIEGVAQ